MNMNMENEEIKDFYWDIESINELLQNSDSNVNKKDAKELTPLLWSTLNGVDLSIIKKLIKRGANLEDVDKDGNSSLMLASQYSNDSSSLKHVQLLIQSGANINHQIGRAHV